LSCILALMFSIVSDDSTSKGDGLTSQGLDKKAKDEVERRLLLDVVIRECSLGGDEG